MNEITNELSNRQTDYQTNVDWVIPESEDLLYWEMFCSPEFAIPKQANPVVINNNMELFAEAIRIVQAVVREGLGIWMISEDCYLYYLHLQTSELGTPAPSSSSIHDSKLF